MQAKHQQDPDAIAQLASMIKALIQDIGHLSQCDGIVAVPPAPEKPFDLPCTLANILCTASGKPNLTGAAGFGGQKESLKDLPVAEKWSGWDASCLCYDQDMISGKSIVLLDDKYQSGATMHYVASALLVAGASEVHGLTVVKTLRDTDNSDVTDD